MTTNKGSYIKGGLISFNIKVHMINNLDSREYKPKLQEDFVFVGHGKAHLSNPFLKLRKTEFIRLPTLRKGNTSNCLITSQQEKVRDRYLQAFWILDWLL